MQSVGYEPTRVTYHVGADNPSGPRQPAWAREFLAALQAHRAGVYVNFLDSDDDTSRVREAYSNDTNRRLADVKTKYDPGNVLHNNMNIHPQTHTQ
jgi:berberine-like enzyme